MDNLKEKYINILSRNENSEVCDGCLSNRDEIWAVASRFGPFSLTSLCESCYKGEKILVGVNEFLVIFQKMAFAVYFDQKQYCLENKYRGCYCGDMCTDELIDSEEHREAFIDAMISRNMLIELRVPPAYFAGHFCSARGQGVYIDDSTVYLSSSSGVRCFVTISLGEKTFETFKIMIVSRSDKNYAFPSDVRIVNRYLSERFKDCDPELQSVGVES